MHVFLCIFAWLRAFFCLSVADHIGLRENCHELLTVKLAPMQLVKQIQVI